MAAALNGSVYLGQINGKDTYFGFGVASLETVGAKNAKQLISGAQQTISEAGLRYARQQAVKTAWKQEAELIRQGA